MAALLGLSEPFCARCRSAAILRVARKMECVKAVLMTCEAARSGDVPGLGSRYRKR
jgi:hypothetical protein